MEIRKVGVVGLGTMGAGIAQVSVQAGFETVGREVSDDLAQRGGSTIERYLTRGVEKGRLSQEERDGAVGRLTLTTELADLADCDLVIEAVLEELDLKRQVFSELDRVRVHEARLGNVMARQLDLDRGDVDAGDAMPARELAGARHATPAAELQHVRPVGKARVEVAEPRERRRVDPPGPLGVAQRDRVVAARNDLFRVARDGPPSHLPHARRVTVTGVR